MSSTSPGAINRTPSSAAIWAAMLSVYFVWGSTYLAISIAIRTIPPFCMAGMRFLLAGGILLAWRLLSGDKKPSFRQWRSAALIGFFLILGGNGGVVWAEQFVPSGIAALMVGSSPLWMILIDAFRPGRQTALSKRGVSSVVGVVLGFIGIAVLVMPTDLSHLGESVNPLGAAVLTLSAISWAVGSIVNRGAHLPDSPLLGTAMEMLAGGFLLMLVSAIAGEWGTFQVSQFSGESLAGLVYLIIFGSFVGFSAYTWLLRVAPTALVSTYAYVNPLVAIFVGNLLAAEPLTPRVLVAAAVIAGAVAMISFSRSATKKTPEKWSEPSIDSGDK